MKIKSTAEKRRRALMGQKLSTYDRDLQLFHSEIQEAMGFKETEIRARSKKLRSSSLPYCALRNYVGLLNGEDNESEFDISGLYYTGVGTFTHELLQNLLPRQFEKISVLARWDPDSIDCKVKKCPQRQHDNINEMDASGCKKCGKYPEHVELDADSTFTSHVDKVYIVKGTKRAYIIDVKTCSIMHIFAYMRGEKVLPHPPYVEQLDSYCVQLYPILTKLGYTLAGSFIFYVPRDNPNRYKFIPVRRKITKGWIKKKKCKFDRMAKGWQTVNRAIRFDLFDMDMAKEIMKYRICKSREWYEKNIETQYNVCDHAKVCFNKKASKTRLRKLVKEFKKNG